MCEVRENTMQQNTNILSTSEERQEKNVSNSYLLKEILFKAQVSVFSFGASGPNRNAVQMTNLKAQGS